MEKDCERVRAEERAFRLLTRRAHSEKELRTKLRAGGFSTSAVEETIQRCRELGYLDDGSFAVRRARVLAVDRLEGNRRIIRDLRSRGIDDELCRRAVEEARRQLGEEEAAERLLRKRIRGRATAALDERERARLARGLLGKGFPTALVLKTLRMTEGYGFHDDDGE